MDHRTPTCRRAIKRREFLKDTTIQVAGMVAGAPLLAKTFPNLVSTHRDERSSARARRFPECAFAPDTGTFAAHVERHHPWSVRDLRLVFRLNGQEYGLSGARSAGSGPASDREVFGPGQATRYVLPKVGDRPTLRVTVAAYENPPRLRMHYEVENDTARDTCVDSVEMSAMLTAPGWDGPLRVFVNSGSQGFSGSQWIEQGGQTAYLGVVAPEGGRSNLLAGGISYRRTDTHLSFVRATGREVHFLASMPYHMLLLPKGQVLHGEDVEFMVHPDPHRLLESYADEVARLLGVRVQPDLSGMWNLWYAYWDPTSSQITEKQILKGADVLNETLGKYGIRYISSGVWQNRAAFGEREPWPGNFPRGLSGVARSLRNKGYRLMSGGFMAKVSSCTEVFEKHPEWLVHDENQKPIQLAATSWGACPYPCYSLDITHPEAAAWFEDWARELTAGGDVDYLWMDFEGTGPGHHYDETVCAPFETDRRRIAMVRKVVGPQGKIGTYTSPTNRYVGLVDRVRLGSDAGGINLSVPADDRWKFLMTCVRNMAAGYFYHGRFWWNDPDPGMPGDQELPETLEEGRCRLLYSALCGSFVTIGQRLSEIAPTRLRLLQQSLPPVGIAARPLDLFRNETPSIFDWALKTDWDAWHVVTLINWNPEGARTFELQLTDLRLPGPQWVYELWTAEYLGEAVGEARLTVPARASRVFVLRPKRNHPWLLATDLHVAMGYHELKYVQWNRAIGTLSAVVERPADMSGEVVAVVPEGWKIRDPGPARAEAHVVRVPVDFRNGPVKLSLHFARA